MSLYSERFKEQIPEIYKKAEIEDFQLEKPELVCFFKNWMKNPVSIFIHGGYGTGKTYLTYALIKKLISIFGFWPIFYSSPTLDNFLLSATRSEEGERYQINKLCDSDILIIDDLGKETKSERLMRQYFQILDYRYAHRKLTVITSNFKLYDLEPSFDGAILSRLQTLVFLEIAGSDRRKK